MSGETKINYWKIGTLVIVAILLIGGGFFLGRKTVKIPADKPPVYIELPPIHDTINKPVPVKEKIDTANFIKNCIASGKFYDLFPEKVKDSIIVIDKTDSTKIVKDWITERTYEETLFDSDTLGKLDVTAKVQYNQLMSLGYNYVPMQKQQEVVQNQIKYFSPFIGAGISTLPTIEVDLGAFIKDSWGVSVSGRYNMRYEQQGINKYDISLKVIKKF